MTRQLMLLATVPVLWGSVGGLAYIAHIIGASTGTDTVLPTLIICFTLAGGLMRWTGECVHRIIELSRGDHIGSVRMEE